jgi:hypothetical protein
VVVLQELFMLSVSQEVYAREIRQLFNRPELFEIQYQTMAFGLLINIDRYDFWRFNADLHCLERPIV